MEPVDDSLRDSSLVPASTPKMTEREPENTSRRRAVDRARVASLDVEISALEFALKALRAERKLAQEWLDAYIYPVLTLPNEITSAIFLRYLPPYPQRPSPSPPLFGDASPTTLGQICRQWRAVAHSTPALWRAIDFVDVDRDPVPDIARTWLQRSGALPISFQFAAATPSTSLFRREQMFSELLLHRSRWAYASINLPFNRLCDVVFRSSLRIDGVLQNLLQLDVFVAENGTLAPVGPLVAPSLRTVSLHVYGTFSSYEKLSKIMSIPWAQLTRLFLDELSPLLVVEILSRTRRLVSCRISLDDRGPGPLDDRGSSGSSLLQLERLETLVLGFSLHANFTEQGSFLALLRMPALQKLQIDQDFLPGDDDSRPTALETWIRGLNCSLQRLCVLDPRSSEERYRTVFSHIPQMEFNMYDEPIDSTHWGRWEF
ncbi:F-box domain-containing protein [Mycena chlorophos]|uniref:F-box domain-containing protein n=1 Tax=Mycena chlorophos TaxID=658473 RepID=A0A8H6TNI6_MYCCL|nr:F-box domain-containing protein [Mycena chlorophos]